ncbi:hypothetical protein MPL3356_110220 [Mesorhizobium plurifarium]|uniref:Uncharacterized protein n=1 Tax=Mesorhizobium plurifarium TaxID=69974 RepID=A0A090EXT2_MESPL|nr:hypothetical protein MPL3356_110220 [Mesorhizobium plurifarium]
MIVERANIEFLPIRSIEGEPESTAFVPLERSSLFEIFSGPDHAEALTPLSIDIRARLARDRFEQRHCGSGFRRKGNDSSRVTVSGTNPASIL